MMDAVVEQLKFVAAYLYPLTWLTILNAQLCPGNWYLGMGLHAEGHCSHNPKYHCPSR